MSVYVDDMQVCIRSKKWPYNKACHLVADSVSELQEFAQLMPLHSSWFQSESIPHFDLTTRMRQRAISLGALPVKQKRFVRITRKYRKRSKELEQKLLNERIRNVAGNDLHKEESRSH